MQCVTPANWTYCRFEQDNFMAVITFGATPESIKEDHMEYFVTVLEDERTEIFQERFNTLSEACLYLNHHYSDWTFKDQTAKGSGCSTCAAH